MVPQFTCGFVSLFLLLTSILAIFGYVDFNTPGTFSTLPQIFDAGYALSKDKICLGHRPLLSRNPLTYARQYVWQTYAEVDERRRNIGSAIHTLFENGTVGSGEYPTVGLWSLNRPGEYLSSDSVCCSMLIAD